jgi:hypothetical protein
MLFVWIFLILGAFFLIALVDFVLRNPMFAETFAIKIGVPFTQIEYIQEDVGFIYIIAGSLLLGALLIAISTWVLDAKRKLKVRGLRKELKSLQKSIEEAKASLPEQEEQKGEDAETVTDMADGDESPEISLGPEEITKSFEDAVKGGDFLDKSSEEEPDEEHVPESQADEEDKYSDENEVKPLPQDTAIEAEVVSSDEQATEDDAASQETAEEKKQSDEA